MTKLITYGSYVLILIGIGIHLIVGIQQPLFGDEIHSIFFANSYSYQELITKPIEVIHPNTYYLVIKFLINLGLSVTGLRVIQWAVFCLSLIPVYGIFRKLKLSENLALVGLVAWTWSSYLLRFSYMIRMYGLGMLLITLSIYMAMNHKFISQLVIDFLGVNLVMGYWFFIPIKYATLFFKHKRESILALTFLALIAIPTYQNAVNARQSISTNYLYWVPIPQATDVLSMTTALLGLTSTAYFEGYAPTPTSLPVTLLLLFCLLSIAIMYLKKTKVTFITKLAIASLCFYSALFVISLVFNLQLFHIRQLFPVAIIFTLFLTYASLSLIRQRYLLTYIIIIPIIIFGMRKTITYAFGPDAIYPAHYQNKPSGQVYFTTADIELAYKYCGATSYVDLTTKCPAKDLHLLTPTTIFPDTFSATLSVASQITDPISCSPISSNFQSCTKREE